MLHVLTLTVVAGTALSPVRVPQDAGTVLEEMRARQIARWESVDNYTIFQKMVGLEFPEMPGVTESGELETPMHYQKHVIEGQPAFGLVPANEYMLAVERAGERGEFVNAEFFEQAGDGYRMVADAFEAEMTKAGAPMMLPGMSYPGQMLRENAMFADAGAEAIRQAEAGDFGRANAAASLAAHREMARTMTLVGRENIEGREAFHLRADGLDRELTPPGDAHRFTLRSASVWIDAEHYVMLRTLMEGELAAEGQTRDVTLEQLFQDYRSVGPLYESHRQVMRMSGLMGAMDAKQREELEEAQRQMEEMEKQLDQLPAAARGMVERQMEQARSQMNMLANDSFEMASEALRIEINTGPPPLDE